MHLCLHSGSSALYRTHSRANPFCCSIIRMHLSGFNECPYCTSISLKYCLSNKNAPFENLIAQTPLGRLSMILRRHRFDFGKKKSLLLFSPRMSRQQWHHCSFLYILLQLVTDCRDITKWKRDHKQQITMRLLKHSL